MLPPTVDKLIFLVVCEFLVLKRNIVICDNSLVHYRFKLNL